MAADQLPWAASCSAEARCSAEVSSPPPNSADSRPRLVRMVRMAIRMATTTATATNSNTTVSVNQPPGTDDASTVSL